jgi:GGDEF domain-containing protein
MMKTDPSSPGFCVLDGDDLLGVITRNDLYKVISGQYGYTLYANKPIKNILSTEFMHVDCQTTIDVVAKKAMQRDYDKIYDFITVLKENKYIGIVTVKELLEKSIEIEILNAKHLNPLSELPGNLLIEQQLESCLVSDCDCYILYFDLDNFKAYNDAYGFENGDRVLKCFTRLLKGNIQNGSFIGHIGGDDFLAIVEKAHVISTCEAIIDEFDRSILSFYNQDDIDKGFIISRNRYGIEESFPLLSLSIAGVASKNYTSIFELAEHVGKIKKDCKEIAGSNFMIA